MPKKWEPGTWSWSWSRPVLGSGPKILELGPKFLDPVQLRLGPQNWTGYLVLLSPSLGFKILITVKQEIIIIFFGEIGLIGFVVVLMKIFWYFMNCMGLEIYVCPCFVKGFHVDLFFLIMWKKCCVQYMLEWVVCLCL